MTTTTMTMTMALRMQFQMIMQHACANNADIFLLLEKSNKDKTCTFDATGVAKRPSCVVGLWLCPKPVESV